MVRFGVCAGRRETGERLKELLLLWADLTCLELELVRWEDLAGMAAGAPAAGCALLFLDAEDWGPPQWSVARQLTEECPEADLVLLSGDPRAAIDSYALHPAGFLKKPVGFRPLAGVLRRCLRVWRDGLRWLEVPANRLMVRVPLCGLLYAEAVGRNCTLHLSGGEVRISRSLGWTEGRLPTGPFLRCQKSFIVNLRAVRRFSGGSFEMEDGAIIAVGRARRGDARQRYEILGRLMEAEEG